MTRREQILAAAVVLLIGVLAGVLLVVLTDDDDATDTATTSTTEPPTSSATSTSTSPPPASTTTAPADSTTSTAAPPVADTTTTSATSAVPTIDAVTGALLGFDIGAPLTEVIAALSARHGSPDQDSDWVPWCEFVNPDGPPDRRYISFGDLRLEFDRSQGSDVLKTWQYLPTFGTTTEPEVVDYDDVLLPDGIAWFDPLDDVAAILGPPVTNDDFGQTFVLTPVVRFSSVDAFADPVFDALGGGDLAVCD